jgi:hypothetical protein
VLEVLFKFFVIFEEMLNLVLITLEDLATLIIESLLDVV